MPRAKRRPTHAGSWYEDDAVVLSGQIAEWLAKAPKPAGAGARAIIAPHAGYRYCGHVMAHAYKYIDAASVQRIFLLGPSHHVYSRKCCLSTASHYSTPLGDMEIDMEVYSELKAMGQFEEMDIGVDEAEHSLELHTPYIVHSMQGSPFKLVPIMVGALTPASEAEYGKILSPYLADPANLFIVSSDFCHWGQRFSYTWYDQSLGPIHKAIEWLDKKGMGIIESGDPKAFEQYLRETRNTVCGRHPIAVFLNMMDVSKTPMKFEFKQYDQSSKCMTQRDSSVSYAAAVATAM